MENVRVFSIIEKIWLNIWFLLKLFKHLNCLIGIIDNLVILKFRNFKELNFKRRNNLRRQILYKSPVNSTKKTNFL